MLAPEDDFVTKQLRTLEEQHPWITKSCITWYDHWKPGYWQRMSHCPYCTTVIPSEVEVPCCLQFYSLIWNKAGFKSSCFSPLHNNKVYYKKTWEQNGRFCRLWEEYWIEVNVCSTCGQPLSSVCFPCAQPLSSVQEPCCHASIMHRLNVGEVGSSSCTMPAPKQS